MIDNKKLNIKNIVDNNKEKDTNEYLDSCIWTQQDDWENSNIYDTECNSSFMIAEETPKDNGFKYCCYCGKKLIQVLYESE